MKLNGKEFNMHWIYSFDMKYVQTPKYLLDEFLEKYSLDFEITGGNHFMENFIWLDVEQFWSKISLHLDACI